MQSNLFCGRCEFCLSDRDFLCIQLRVLGERLEGTYAEYVKLPAQNCFKIPQGYTFEEAAAFPLVFVTLWRMPPGIAATSTASRTSFGLAPSVMARSL